MTTIDPRTAEEFDNDDPAHRAALVSALREQGLDAYEYHIGGGAIHVVVELVNGEPHDEDLLVIATGSAQTPCDVGLMGWNASGYVESGEWARTPSLTEVVDAFRHFNDRRETWIARFRAGEMNA